MPIYTPSLQTPANDLKGELTKDITICLNQSSINTSKIHNNSLIDEDNRPKFLANPDSVAYTKKLKYIEELRRNIRSMYVLSFLENEDLFEFFKSILLYSKNLHEESDMYEEASSSTNGSDSKGQCKYLHMIIQNPVDKNEAYEIGLKIIDIIESKSKH